MTRTSNEPAFLLHATPYRETSLIVDLFTRDYGRVAAIAKGAKRPRSALRAVLLQFQPLSVSFSGRGELRTLTAAEWAGGAVSPRGRRVAVCVLPERTAGAIAAARGLASGTVRCLLRGDRGAVLATPRSTRRFAASSGGCCARSAMRPTCATTRRVASDRSAARLPTGRRAKASSWSPASPRRAQGHERGTVRGATLLGLGRRANRYSERPFAGKIPDPRDPGTSPRRGRAQDASDPDRPAETLKRSIR